MEYILSCYHNIEYLLGHCGPLLACIICKFKTNFPSQNTKKKKRKYKLLVMFGHPAETSLSF